MLGVVPSIVSHWKKSRCMENLDWRAIKCFSSTGEVSNPEEMEYLMALGKINLLLNIVAEQKLVVVMSQVPSFSRILPVLFLPKLWVVNLFY